MFLLNISTSINNQSSRFQADGFQAPTCSPLPRGLRVPPMFSFWLIILFPIFIYITQQKSPKAALCQETSKHNVSPREHRPTTRVSFNHHFGAECVKTFPSIWSQQDLLRSFADYRCIHDYSVLSASFPVLNHRILMLCSSLIKQEGKKIWQKNKKTSIQIPPDCTKKKN